MPLHHGNKCRCNHRTSRRITVTNAVRVRLTGLEPAHRKTIDPKSIASTNFATGAWAFLLIICKSDAKGTTKIRNMQGKCKKRCKKFVGMEKKYYLCTRIQDFGGPQSSAGYQ